MIGDAIVQWEVEGVELPLSYTNVLQNNGNSALERRHKVYTSEQQQYR